MKLLLESTPDIVELDGVPTRLWVGETASGVPVRAYIHRLSPQTNDPEAVAAFEGELQAARAPITAALNEDADEGPTLGPCCVCETTNGVHSIIMLGRRAALPGSGWGCFSCRLPNDGAFAVLCDACLERWKADESILETACRGVPATDGRIAIADLPPGEFRCSCDRAKDGAVQETLTRSLVLASEAKAAEHGWPIVLDSLLSAYMSIAVQTMGPDNLTTILKRSQQDVGRFAAVARAQRGGPQGTA
jgi:hypothetical protein